MPSFSWSLKEILEDELSLEVSVRPMPYLQLGISLLTI